MAELAYQEIQHIFHLLSGTLHSEFPRQCRKQLKCMCMVQELLGDNVCQELSAYHHNLPSPVF